MGDELTYDALVDALADYGKEFEEEEKRRWDDWRRRFDVFVIRKRDGQVIVAETTDPDTPKVYFEHPDFIGGRHRDGGILCEEGEDLGALQLLLAAYDATKAG